MGGTTGSVSRSTHLSIEGLVGDCDERSLVGTPRDLDGEGSVASGCDAGAEGRLDVGLGAALVLKGIEVRVVDVAQKVLATLLVVDGELAVEEVHVGAFEGNVARRRLVGEADVMSSAVGGHDQGPGGLKQSGGGEAGEGAGAEQQARVVQVNDVG